MIRITEIQIPTLPTQKPRRLYVSLPDGYDACDTRYPVLYMFDGHNVFYDSHATYGKSWGMQAYLKESRRQIILVAIECNPEGFRRLFEYSPWDFKAPKPIGAVQGLGNVTMDWITGVLKPEIDRTYRTLPDRADTMIAGSSMGGLMAIYAAVAYNETFSRAASLSPSLWVNPNGMAELIKTTPLAKPTRIYIDMGTDEPRESAQLITAMFETAKLLSKAGAVVAAETIPDAQHNEAAWGKRIPVFFDYLM